MMPLSHRRILHPDYLLAAIKLLHTAIWAVLAGFILALPVAAFTRHFRWALILTAFVVCECAVLAANRGRCPLTDWAARFTEDRAANFDIYLPDWLARNNKAIFGTLFAVNELIVLWRWLVQP
jgi:FtsH-binding integral membrane protein